MAIARKISLVLVAAALLLSSAGCTAPNPMDKIFAVDADSSDHLPAGDQGSVAVDPASARYAGADTAGGQYYFARTPQGDEFCLLVFMKDGIVSTGCARQLPLRFGFEDYTFDVVETLPTPIPEGSEAVGDHVVVSR